MNSTVRLKFDVRVKIAVKAGDIITPKTILGEVNRKSYEETVSLSDILRVPPAKISRYLKKGIGEEVTCGQILAEKKSLFSTSQIKSPVSGIIKEVNLTSGDVVITVGEGSIKENLLLPFSGKITSVREDRLDIEINGVVYDGISGYGNMFGGELIYYPKDRLEVMDLISDCNGKVVLCNSVDADTAIKLDVVGASGLIIRRVPRDLSLPWIDVSDEVFVKLKEYAGNKVFILPGQIQIVVLK